MADDIESIVESVRVKAGAPIISTQDEPPVWGKIEQIRAKQAAKPKHSPLPVVTRAETAPVAHQGEREAIAREVASTAERIDVKAIWKAHGGAQHGPNVEQYYIEEQAFYRFASAYRDAILSLTPSPQFPDRVTLVQIIFRNTGCESSAAERAANAILSMEPLTPSPAGEGSVAEYNDAFDPADEAFGGAFREGFREGWIFAQAPDGTDYDEISESYGRVVDIEPSEAWHGYRGKYFAMLPLAALPPTP